MKKNMTLVLCSVVSFLAMYAQVRTQRNLEGNCVRTQTEKTSGYEMAEALSPDGKKIVQYAYKWYSGYATANDKHTAIEMAQREAYATISRTVNNAIYDVGERMSGGYNANVQQAIASRWLQVSESVIRGCEPFGDVVVEYDPATRYYNVTAKVAMRGDRFNKLLDEANNYTPRNLTPEEVNVFVNVNVAIVNIMKAY